ncbi:uncharacterized protein LOC129974465 [Argiope bruennichi]|uniref:uncharacterized protein LOC129974465 n=1 Tax=Argiope bruennichi TaxID=94029 RepID=UPI002495456B|nr:uncharacterized protein LOC129974465 [Argiope bruennichi]
MGHSKRAPFSGQQSKPKKIIDNHFDTFFVIHRTSDLKETFHTVSPFLVEKAITGSLGEVESIRKLRSGDLLVEVKTRKQSQQILKLKNLATIPVSVSAHSSMNNCKGVITCGELFNETIEKITAELAFEGVTHVRRISVRRDGKLLPTKHLILTFHRPKLPEYIKAGYMRSPVRPYIPNPLRCFQCQRFGHAKTACRGSITCAHCAEKGHESEHCNAQEKCVNCFGTHTSYSRSCPRWQIEKQIVAVKFKENISYPEARRRVTAQTPVPGISYASATQGKIDKNISRKLSLENSTNSDSEPSGNTVPETPKLQKATLKSKSQKSLALKLSKRGLSPKALPSKLKKSLVHNSVALGLASQGVAHKDLTSIFGGASKGPDLISLHPSEEDEDLKMSCDISPTQSNVPTVSDATKIT